MGSALTFLGNRPHQHGICWRCTTKFQRQRQASCKCNHCSYPLCLTCKNEHDHELRQDVAELIEQLCNLQQLCREKQTMVDDAVVEAADDFEDYFTDFQSELIATSLAIARELENEKQQAKTYLEHVCSQLTVMNGSIDTLARKCIAQPNQMDMLQNQLNSLREQLQTYQMTKDIRLPTVLPRYSLKFQFSPTGGATTTETTASETLSSSTNSRNGKRKRSRNKHHPYKAPVTRSAGQRQNARDGSG